MLLDIVVRDKKGSPVRDLDPKEVQVIEDGVAPRSDRVPACRGTGERRALAGASAGRGLQPDPSRQVSLVTMVFDKLLDDRQLAEQAALDFIANNMQSNVWMSVLTIDQRLDAAAGLHADPYSLKQAIYAATSTTSVTAASLAGQAALEEQHSPRTPSDRRAGRQSAAVRRATAGRRSGCEHHRRGQRRRADGASHRGHPALHRQHPARSSRGSRRSIRCSAWSRRRARLAGRKTLIYFSEGLVVPKNLEEVFQTDDQRGQPRQRHGLCRRCARPELVEGLGRQARSSC